MLRQGNTNSKSNAFFRRKIVMIICIIYIVLFSSFLFLFYGPIDSFKEFWITTAMTTMNHRYLATWLYSDSYIQKVLKKNSIIEVNEISDPTQISFKNHMSFNIRVLYSAICTQWNS